MPTTMQGASRRVGGGKDNAPGIIMLNKNKKMIEISPSGMPPPQDELLPWNPEFLPWNMQGKKMLPSMENLFGKIALEFLLQ